MSITSKAHVSGADLELTVDKMLAITEGLTPNLVYMSCLALALMTQDPKITNQRLRDGIMEASQWMMDYLDEEDEPVLTPEQIN